jgi:hypothetical protein
VDFMSTAQDVEDALASVAAQVGSVGRSLPRTPASLFIACARGRWMETCWSWTGKKRSKEAEA